MNVWREPKADFVATAARNQIMPQVCALLAHRPEVLKSTFLANRAALEAGHCSRLNRQLKQCLNMVKQT